MSSESNSLKNNGQLRFSFENTNETQRSEQVIKQEAKIIPIWPDTKKIDFKILSQIAKEGKSF